MAENYHITYIPPTNLDTFTGVNLSENMGFGVSSTKLSTGGGNAKRAQMGLPQYRSGLNKFISQSSRDVSYINGKETLESVKAAAAGVPTSSPDYSAKLTHAIELAELRKKEPGLTDEQLEAIIRKKRAQREALEKWHQARREAAGDEREISIQSTGSVEMPTLTNVVVDDSPPVYDKQEKLLQTYTQPDTSENSADSAESSGGTAEPAGGQSFESEA